VTSIDEQLAELEGKSVEETLDAIGEDRELGRAVLEREQAKGDKARSTLVGPLETFLAGPEEYVAPDAGQPLSGDEDADEELGPEVFTIRRD
jgi:hypothetical protein